MKEPARSEPAPEPNDDPVPVTRPPRKALVRFGLLLLLLVAGFLILRFTPLGEVLDRERLPQLLGAVRARWWSPLALVGLYAIVSPIGLPISPLMLTGGLVFGFPGILWNIVGACLGAVLSFGLGRVLGQDLIVHVLGQRLLEIERWIEKHGFWALVRLRLLPVPFPLLNYGAALARVSWPVFLGSTLLGLVPSVTVYSYFGAALVKAVGGDRGGLFLQLGGAVAALLALSFLPGWWQRRKNRAG